MKNFTYILRLTFVLLLISAVVAGLLGFVNFLTEDKIAENTAKKAQEAMQNVLPCDSYEALEVSEEFSGKGVLEAFSCENGYVVRVSVGGFGGMIDLMVGIHLDGAVSGISVVSHAETASLGANCTRADWQAQFVGISEAQQVSKDGGQIDALTGATITSRAVTDGVNLALEFVKEVLG